MVPTTKAPCDHAPSHKGAGHPLRGWRRSRPRSTRSRPRSLHGCGSARKQAQRGYCPRTAPRTRGLARVPSPRCPMTVQPGAHAGDPDPPPGELPTLAIVITAYAYPDPWIGAVPYREISPKSVDHRPVNDRTRPIVHSGVTARLPEVYCHDRRAEGLASRLGRSRRSRTDRAGKRETRRYSPTNAVQALCQHGTLGSASGLGSRLAGMQPTDRLDRRNYRAGIVSWRPFRYRLWWWNCTFGRDLMTADT